MKPIIRAIPGFARHWQDNHSSSLENPFCQGGGPYLYRSLHGLRFRLSRHHQGMPDAEKSQVQAELGQGVVRVHVIPWAVVKVDGATVGETPQELRLPAGAHRLRAEHPTLGAAELELTVEPGRRQLWRPALKR